MSEDARRLDEALSHGLAALDEGRLDEADDALERARKYGGENHPRVLHLAGLLALAEGDTERGLGYLMQATDQGPPHAEIYLDCAEALLIARDDVDEAEVVVRQALDLPELGERERCEATLTLAQIRLDRMDVDGAMALLDAVGCELEEHPAFLSTKSAALLAAGRGDEAVEAARKAAEVDPNDPDFWYQLALTLQEVGRDDEAVEIMEKVWRLDTADAPAEPVTPEESALLVDLTEQAIADLPDPLMRLVAPAPIATQARATLEQVRAGLDPRSDVLFEGTPARDGASARLERIIVLRDHVTEGATSEDDVASSLLYAVVDGIRTFFGRSDLVFGEATVDA